MVLLLVYLFIMMQLYLEEMVKTIEAGVETLGVKYPVNHGGGISFNGKN